MNKKKCIMINTDVDNTDVDNSEYIKILEIKNKKDYYGDLVYNTNDDNVYFKNRFKEYLNLCQKTKSFNKVNFKKELFFGIFVKQSCCYIYDKLSGISNLELSQCVNNHTNPNDSINNLLKINIKNEILNIPINVIIKNNTSSYDFINDGSIIFKKKGFYRITYNIVYEGNLSKIQSKIIAFNGNNYEEIPYSLNKNNNVCINEIEVINHTFFLQIKNNLIGLKLYLSLIFINQMNKTVIIHPVQTWLHIEKLQ